MAKGIIVCGLNGAGKSTLARIFESGDLFEREQAFFMVKSREENIGLNQAGKFKYYL